MAVGYDYAHGHYRNESPADVEFAGFQMVASTDSAGSRVETYYHQGNGSDALTYEGDDHKSKIGLPYRTLNIDPDGTVRQRKITLYDRQPAASTGSDRYFVAPVSELSTTIGTDASVASSATANTWDVASGNLLTKTDYGLVDGNGDGSFTDLGGDETVIATYAYAVGTDSNVRADSFVREELIMDGSESLLGRTRLEYDGLPYGSVNRGLMTRKAVLAAEGNPNDTEIVTSATRNNRGLVASATDANGTVTTYAYDAVFYIYPNSETKTIGAVVHTKNYQYHWGLGLLFGWWDPDSKNSEVYAYDILGRMLSRNVSRDPVSGYQYVRVVDNLDI